MPKIGDWFNPSEMFEGIYIVNPILRFKGLSPGAKIVWGRLYRFAGKKGKIFPAMQTVADDIGMSRKQARRYLHELVDMKFLALVADKGHSNDYHFCWHSAFEVALGREAQPLTLAKAYSAPLPDQGVPNFRPLPDQGVPTPPASGSTPLPDQGVIREEVREEYLKEEIPLTPFSREEAPAAQKSNPATAAENPATSLAHEDLTPSGGGFVDQSTFQLDEEVGTFIANVYRQSRGAKSPKAAELKRMAYKIAEKEASHGPEEFRAALLNFLGTSNDWLRENKWPLHTFLKTINGYVVEPQSRSSASRASVASRTSSEAPAIDPAKASDKTQSPADEYVSQWNAVNPERPAGKLMNLTRKKLETAMRNPDFAERFETICEKAAGMIAGGGAASFEWLFGTAKDGQEHWAELLEGKFDFLAKKELASGGLGKAYWANVDREEEEEKKANGPK